ncbi:hypothetical protein [Streptomyces abikoensis]|uniref:hypothetical protein n=1 Tax=Streptomyces abikoensis TaxID=97398 RepID=UPI00167B2908|nr:hypothetical protein [Streptomyces abikoensis]GGP55823.1 hypothetical protein GCM10010214_31270 [Streptomyces abikoensis]
MKQDAIAIAAEAHDRVQEAQAAGTPLTLAQLKEVGELKKWALAAGATEEEIQAARKR